MAKPKPVTPLPETVRNLEIPIEVKRQLLEEELQLHKNTLYVYRLRYDTSMMLGRAQVAESLIPEIEASVRCIDYVEKILEDLPKPE